MRRSGFRSALLRVPYFRLLRHYHPLSRHNNTVSSEALTHTERWTDCITRHEKLGRALSRVSNRPEAVAVHGAGGAAHGFLVTGIADAVSPEDRPVLVVTANSDAAERLRADMQVWSERPVVLLPASDLYLPGPDPVAAARMETLDRLEHEESVIVVASLPAVLQRAQRSVRRVNLTYGATLDLTETAESLSAIGYERVPLVEVPGQFSVRGGILDVFPSTSETPVRVDLFDDFIDSLRVFDPVSQRSGDRVEQVTVLPAADHDASYPPGEATLLDFLPARTPVVIVEVNAVEAQYTEFVRSANAQYEALTAQDEQSVRINRARPVAETHREPSTFREWMLRQSRIYLDVLERTNPWEMPATVVGLASSAVETYQGRVDILARTLRGRADDELDSVVVTQQTKRLTELLAEHDTGLASDKRVEIIRGDQRAGFHLPDFGLFVLSDAEIFGERQTRIARRRFKEAEPISSLTQLKPGDLVVHVTHGIGYYRGLSIISKPDGTESEYIRIDYASSDKVFVPIDQMYRVQKYIGSSERAPTVHRLGASDWTRATARARAQARDMAQELLALYAVRHQAEVLPCAPDTSWQQELESAFPYSETPDQLQAIEDVKSDLTQTRPMDRLICGDVGFGKTEVAVRAAFKVVQEDQQVAILCPTTVLAQQHWNTFRERMSAFPLKIEMLSRFRNPKEIKQVVNGLREGNVDIVIGTHRLLSKDIEFRNLGLLIVDEEQRFGVAHKERIKQLRKNVHVLTLTATPIPRTLHMSLTGIRDMSMMNDPPEGRTPIKTICTEHSDGLVRQAILHEMDRGGQVYYVHNRVENIESIALHLREIVPSARIAVGHGQMAERELEEVMWRFYHGDFDVLLCTTIIESGIDIPNVNTIIIHNADRFGLSQLYQLRGRVGRSPRQAFCYLLYHPGRRMTEEAEQRLQAIREFSQLGSGFRIAMRDLEIRGVGNLLGAQQSGIVAGVGFEYYCQMIQEAVAELKGEAVEEFVLPPVDIPTAAFIPDSYIDDDGLRIAFYKKITAVKNASHLSAVQEELEDRFGDPPKPVWAMLRLLGLRLKMKEGGISGVAGDSRNITISLGKALRPEELLEWRMRRRRWTVNRTSVVVPVTGEALRSAEDAVTRVITDLRR
jgi:transcription-repair coupling factor (superfamily II helicase)